MPSVYRRAGRGPLSCSYTGWDGKRRQVSTGVRDVKVAKMIASHLENQHALVRYGLATPDSLILSERGMIDPATLLDRWVDAIDALPASRKLYRSWIAAFIAEARVGTCLEFGAATIVEKLVKWLAPQACAVETRNKKLVAIRAFGRWLHGGGYCASNRTDGVPLQRPTGERRSVHRALTAAECDALAAGEWGAYYLFRCLTGVRGTECAKIVCGDLRLDDKPSLHVRREVAKNRLECTVPLCGRAADAMRGHCGMGHPDKAVFPVLACGRSARRDAWLRHRDAAGLGADVNERSLRMTFVSWLTASGADLGDVIRLRRDRMRGAEKLAAWNYADDRIIGPRLRAALARMEAWAADNRKARQA